jgi:hypothetical protein
VVVVTFEAGVGWRVVETIEVSVVVVDTEDAAAATLELTACSSSMISVRRSMAL